MEERRADGEGGERGNKNIYKIMKMEENKKFWEEQIAYFPSIRQGPHRK
jgi:hypothetical protein